MAIIGQKSGGTMLNPASVDIISPPAATAFSAV
jgi:hypothetical protein